MSRRVAKSSAATGQSGKFSQHQYSLKTVFWVNLQLKNRDRYFLFPVEYLGQDWDSAVGKV